MLLAAAVTILATKCLSCHDAESKAAGLDLTSRESMMRGGASGPVIIEGNPEESRLFRYVKMGKMPPARPLGGEEIEAVRQWIAEGAPWDAAEAKPRAGLDRWANLGTARMARSPAKAGRFDFVTPLLLRIRNNGHETHNPSICCSAHDAATGLSVTTDWRERHLRSSLRHRRALGHSWRTRDGDRGGSQPHRNLGGPRRVQLVGHLQRHRSDGPPSSLSFTPLPLGYLPNSTFVVFGDLDSREVLTLAARDTSGNVITTHWLTDLVFVGGTTPAQFVAGFMPPSTPALGNTC